MQKSSGAQAESGSSEQVITEATVKQPAIAQTAEATTSTDEKTEQTDLFTKNDNPQKSTSEEKSTIATAKSKTASEQSIQEDNTGDTTSARPNNDPRSNPKKVAAVKVNTITAPQPTSTALDTSKPAPIEAKPSGYSRPSNDPRLKKDSTPDIEDNSDKGAANSS